MNARQLLLTGISIGYKAEFAYSEHFPWFERLLSGRGGNMDMGVQSEARGEVTEHAADGLDVYTILQCDGGEGVSSWYHYDIHPYAFNICTGLQTIVFPASLEVSGYYCFSGINVTRIAEIIQN